MSGKKKAGAKKTGAKKASTKAKAGTKAPGGPSPEIEETDEDHVGGGRVQRRLPGQARERDKTLEQLADDLDEKQKVRLSAAAEEKTARDALTDYMKKNKVSHYDLPGDREAELDLSEPKAKVHKKKAEKDSGGDES